MSQTVSNNKRDQRGSSRKKSSGKGKSPRGRKKGSIWMWSLFLGLFLFVCAVVGYLLVLLNGERILNANMNKLNLDQASIIVDRNGEQIAKLYVSEGNREYVPIGEMPKELLDAFVATEDKRFYDHSGIDLLGIGRALVKDIIARSAVEGASTITQQLAKNLFLNADKTLFRKGTEASIALALEKHKSKEEILELYLNRIYFGKGQYGVKTAAKYYFDVNNLNDLKLWQIATLAGIPKAPSYYNPVSNPERSQDRRAVVLKLMVDQGLISEKERTEAAAVVYKPRNTDANAKYLTYIDYVVEEVKAQTGLTEEELLSAGYTIVTEIDKQAQLAMEAAFNNDKMFEANIGDVKAQGAMVILDQHSGAIVAMIGGRDYGAKGWNRATKKRQPGSAFKPIAVYGPALDSGKYSPTSIVQDVQQCFNKYCPTNSNKVKYRGAISMTEAIKESRNMAAVWMLNEIGVKTGMKFAEKLGVTLDPDDRNLAMALGGLTYGASPLEMARAYAAFANGGLLPDAHAIVSITDGSGKTIYSRGKTKDNRVMSERTAYEMTQMLQTVVKKGGTGVNAAIKGREVAGKTGTTQLGISGVSGGIRDAWFVGYTPEWTAAVWYGFDDTDKTHHLKQGSSQAAAMFSAVMSKALEGKPKLQFETPPPPEEPPASEEQSLQPITGLTGEYHSMNVSIELKWNPSAAEDVVYKVYRKEEGQEFKFYAEVAEAEFEDIGLLPERDYAYYVTTYRASDQEESEQSSTVIVTVTTELTMTPPPDSGETPPATEEPSDTEEPPSNETPPSGEPDDGGEGEPPVTPDPDQPEEEIPVTPSETPPAA